MDNQTTTHQEIDQAVLNTFIAGLKPKSPIKVTKVIGKNKVNKSRQRKTVKELIIRISVEEDDE